MVYDLHRFAMLDPSDALVRAGFRFGDKGTHTSRTMMSAELTDLLAAIPASANREDYEDAIVTDNVLGKSTAATRRLSNQRLGELYGLDRKVPLFRVLRRLWSADEAGRPLIALLAALARDPLLRATAPAVISLPVGAELIRGSFLDAIRDAVGQRLNEAVLDKVARNAASSWSQSGHLEGRVRKIRRQVTPTHGSVALAVWMGMLEGFGGEALLSSRWALLLDCPAGPLLPFALQAKQRGLMNVRAGGGVVEIDASRLDPGPLGS